METRTRLDSALSALLFFVGGFTFLVAIAFLSSQLLRATEAEEPLRGGVLQVGLLLGSIAAVLVLLVAVRRHPAASLGLHVTRGTVAQTLLGAGVGVLIAGLTFGLVAAAGGYRIRLADPALHPSAGFLASTALIRFVGAAFEEVAFRAGLTGPLRAGWSPWVAVIVPAAFFGVAHGLNPGASLASVANTTLAGAVLGLMYLDPAGRPRAPSLGLCTGFHFAWNMAVGTVLGLPVSGNPPSQRWLEVEALDTLWSGAAYGIEAGVATTTVYAALFVFFALRVGRRRPQVSVAPSS